MKKALSIILASAMLMPALAQDIYKVEAFSSKDLIGTARFVGMGGAMSTLGADISTMTTNPAGIGLYRRSDVSLTGSINFQPNATEFYDIGATRASFDQAGFVYTIKSQGGLGYMNFGFNYQKSKNFKNHIDVRNFSTNSLSQSLQMLDLCYVGGDWLDLDITDDADKTTNLAYAGYQTQMLEPVRDAEGKILGYNPCEADHYNYKRVQWGGIQDYDFVIAGNWNDQVYGGVTLGVKNVNFHSFTDYAEMLRDGVGGLHEYYTNYEETISGVGIDAKFGLIVRPISTSPFRIGVSVHTPTLYNLNTDSYLYMNSPFTDGTKNFSEYSIPVERYQYNIRTPWKFNVGVATTIGKSFAIDAEYEFTNPSNGRISYSEGVYGDYYNSYYDKKDIALNQECKKHLRPQHTLRVGAELRLADHYYLRAGYNFISAPMKETAFMDLFTNSNSYYYNSNTDYVNLGATNRFTCGAGYKGRKFYADLAYQYNNQSGDLYTFHVPEANGVTNRLDAAAVDLNKQSVLLTLGLKF